MLELLVLFALFPGAAAAAYYNMPHTPLKLALNGSRSGSENDRDIPALNFEKSFCLRGSNGSSHDLYL